MRFLRSIYGWVKKALRAVFSRKGALVIGSLVALLAVAISLTHFFYNRSVEERWAAVQERWQEGVGPIDLDVYFPAVLPENDLYEDSYVQEYLGREDLPLTNIDSMKLEGVLTISMDGKLPEEVSVDLVGGEILEGKDAVIFLLEAVDQYSEEIGAFTDLMASQKQVGSVYNPQLELTDMDGDWSRLELMGLSRFFNDRARLHLSIGDQAGFQTDLQTIIGCMKIFGNEPTILGMSLKSGQVHACVALLSEAVELHVLSGKELEVFERALRDVDLAGQLERAPIGETIHRNQLLDLYVLHGEDAVHMATAGDDVDYYSEESVFNWDESDWDEKVDFELLVGEMVQPFLPKKFDLMNRVLYDEITLDVLIPHFKKPLNIETYRGLEESMPEYSWSEEWVSPMPEVYVYYYQGLMRVEMMRRLALVGIELEKIYLKTGEYPASLETIEVVDLDDLYSDEKIQYKKLGEWEYVLESIGLKEGGYGASAPVLGETQIVFPIANRE